MTSLKEYKQKKNKLPKPEDVEDKSKEETKKLKKRALEKIKEEDDDTDYSLRYNYESLYKALYNEDESEDSVEKTEEKLNKKKTDKDVNGKMFKEGYDPRRNYDGRPKGSKNFTTLWKEAVKKIAKMRDEELDPDDVELVLVKKAFKKASEGNFKFYKDIMDRVYGKATQKTDITTGGKPINNKQIEDEVEKKLDTIFGDGEEEDSSDT